MVHKAANKNVLPIVEKTHRQLLLGSAIPDAAPPLRVCLLAGVHFMLYKEVFSLKDAGSVKLPRLQVGVESLIHHWPPPPRTLPDSWGRRRNRDSG